MATMPQRTVRSMKSISEGYERVSPVPPSWELPEAPHWLASWRPRRERRAPRTCRSCRRRHRSRTSPWPRTRPRSTLPYIGGATANGVVTKFATVTMGQHLQHADAFNSAIKSLGGKAQTNPDPAFVPVVNKAVNGLTGVSAAAGTLGVVGLALELENIAAETYVKDTTLVSSTSNKALFASIMGIEAQHVAVLLAVQALLKANAPQLISLSEPATVEALPAAAGSVGFPNAFYKTNNAAPASQGAVK